MKLTTGYKKPIASSGTDAQEQSSNNSYLLLAGGGHKALSELVSPADLTTALSNYVTIGSNQTITGVKTFSQTINANITGNASTATNVNWSGVTNRPTNVSAFNNDVGYVTTDTTYSTATSDTLGLVKIGYTANDKNYPVQLSNGQMYVNVLWTDTWRPITDSYSGTSSNTSLSQNGGKAIYDALVNGYATNAGDARTLNGYTSDDFVLKTTHDVYESVIAESLNDLDRRIDEAMPNISIGTVTTVDSSQDAKVTISGTKPNVVINFSIPRGEQGDLKELNDTSERIEAVKQWQSSSSVIFASVVEVPIPTEQAMYSLPDCIKQTNLLTNLKIIHNSSSAYYQCNALHWHIQCSNINSSKVVYSTKYATPDADFTAVSNVVNPAPPTTIEITVTSEKGGARNVHVAIENVYGRAYYYVTKK